jgi:hypothetical protein
MNPGTRCIGLGTCALLVLSVLRWSGSHPPTREDFAKYPSLRQRWQMLCDPRSDLARVNAEGCAQLQQWQTADAQPVLDHLMNRNLGK